MNNNQVNENNNSDINSLSDRNIDNNNAVTDIESANQVSQSNNPVEKIPVNSTQESFISNNENMLVPSKNKSSKKIIVPIIFVLGMLLIAAGGLLTYFKFFNNPKIVFGKVISSSLNSFYERLETNYNTFSGEGEFSYKITASDEALKPIIEALNGIKLDYKYSLDKKNKLFNFDFNSSYNDEKLLNLNAYGSDSKIYFLLKDIFDKYIYNEIDQYDKLFESFDQTEDIKIILKSIKKALDKGFSNDDFIRESTVIKIDEKDTKVNSNTLVLTKEKMNSISKTIATVLKDDEEFIKAFDKISDTNSTKEDLEEFIKEDNTNDFVESTIIIYTKGLLNEFVGLKISTDDDNKTNLLLVKENEKLYKAEFKNDNEIVLTISFKFNSISDNKVDLTLNLDIPKALNIEVNSKYSVKYNDAFNKKDITSNVNINDLTEEDTNTIMTNLMECEGLKKLIEKIQPLVESFMDSFDGNDYENSFEFDDSSFGY